MSQFPVVAAPDNVLWEKLDEQTLSVAAASITFSGIAATFTFLRVTSYLQKDATGGLVQLRFNNDSGANYDHQYIRGNAGSTTGARVTGDTHIDDSVGTTGDDPIHSVILVAKPVSGEEAQVVITQGQDAPAAMLLHLQGGQWNDTAALVSRVDLIASAGNWDTDSRVLLEGAQPA